MPRPSPHRARFSSGLFDELIVDNFAGGGGASLGIERAMGRAVDVAINHDDEAVALHKANHPHTIHYCENVWRVDPLEATRGKPVGLAWFSPDCTHFSRAKGGKPVKKKIRGLAWIVVRWARRVRPRVIMLENVREFETWGPLGDDDRPCPLRKGITFKRWVGYLRGLGYDVEWRELNAADFGAPTHRRRLFLIARSDGQPIVWPEPTHGPGRSKPWRTAAECIDWSIPCPSIFLTTEEAKPLGVIRPLAEKTMKRIAMGLKRYVLENPRPFVVRVNHGGEHFRGQAVDAPLSTITGAHGHGLVAPFLTAQYGERPGQAPRSHRADAPIPVITPRDGGGFPLILPRLEPGEFRGQSVESPLGTVTSVARPAVIAPTLIQYNQEKGGEVRGKAITDPINTIPTENRFGLVSAFIAKHYTGVVGHGPDRPIGTVTGVDHHSVVAANMIKMNFGDKQWSAADEPLRTVLAGANHHGLVHASLLKYYGTGEDTKGENQALTDPAHTVVARQRFALVQAFLTQYNGRPTDPRIDEPLHTIVGRDRFGLVTVGSQDYVIADIGLRMLSPRELYRAQGFPDSYRIDIPGPTGKRLPKSAQVRMCGNSVSPPVAEALVRANFAEARQPALAREGA